MLLKRQQTLRVLAIQEVHQVLFFLNESCFGQFTLELAKDLLLGQALPPEVNESVNLLFPGNSLYTFASLTIKLIDEHFNEAAHVLISTEG